MNEEETKIKKIIAKYNDVSEEAWEEYLENLSLIELEDNWLIKAGDNYIDRKISSPKAFFLILEDKSYDNNLYYFVNKSENYVLLFFLTSADNPLSYYTKISMEAI